MINFNEGIEQPNKFLGSEKKTTILLGNKVYMLKYPDPIRGNKSRFVISYKNNHFSEHIGSSVFRSCGFDTQETVLGYYTDYSGKRKIVVGCVDFTQDGSTLFEMTKLANQMISSDEKMATTIEHVTLIVSDLPFITDKTGVIERFWDVFVVDTLIGNGDRHFGNWGLLEKEGVLRFAPIYDCGSSLGALLDDSEMADIMESDTRLKAKEYNVTSCYSFNGKRIFCHEIYKDPPEELLQAVKRIVPLIDMERIHGIIDSVEPMSEVRKEYLKKATTLRYEQILLPCLNRTLRHLMSQSEKPSIMEKIRKTQAEQRERDYSAPRKTKRKDEPEL